MIKKWVFFTSVNADNAPVFSSNGQSLTLKAGTRFVWYGRGGVFTVENEVTINTSYPGAAMIILFNKTSKEFIATSYTDYTDYINDDNLIVCFIVGQNITINSPVYVVGTTVYYQKNAYDSIEINKKCFSFKFKFRKKYS